MNRHKFLIKWCWLTNLIEAYEFFSGSANQKPFWASNLKYTRFFVRAELNSLNRCPISNTQNIALYTQ
ncbi:hypothetical protein BpHYR1_024527 [Brachionus plicatilis]|uniref:Uncharacterized protein n=1 Tax=Brachionus plicatilis TaxID=10195 RepID=A0A3M7RAP1_BRAPC|nr:hypothetical protein BpHYR1_024527 [Brachionus plicatilis]